MWEKFAPTHRSRDAAHAQWLQTYCQWYPTGDVRTHTQERIAVGSSNMVEGWIT